MDLLVLFAKGLLIGLVIAAPVGPIGFLCIHRTLQYGATIGLLTGLGAAAADAAYGAVAAFGLRQLAQSLSEHDVVLRLFGGLVLGVIGLRVLLTADRPQRQESKGRVRGAPALDSSDARFARRLVESFASAFLLTLANPATILSFLAIFAALGWASDVRSHHAAALLVAGVFVGSALWWLGLSSAAGLLREHMGEAQRAWIQRASGAAIFGFGLFAVLSVLM